MTQFNHGPGRTTIILDSSTSTSTIGKKGDRFDLAQEQKKSPAITAAAQREVAQARLDAFHNGKNSPASYINDIGRVFKIDQNTRVSVLSPQETKAAALRLFQDVLGIKGAIEA